MPRARSGRCASACSAPARVGREVVRALLERSPGACARRRRAARARRRGGPRRRPGAGRRHPDDLLTDAPAHLVAAPDVDVVVELMGGDEPARTLIAAALARRQGRRDREQARARASRPGARGGSRADRRAAPLRGGGRRRDPRPGPARAGPRGEPRRRIRGIVNGTTNYILTAMAGEGRGYADVLAEAQAPGYAEADPTGDVEGVDAVNKLVVLARLAFGAWIDPARVGDRPGTTRRGPAARESPASRRTTSPALAARGPRSLRLLATRAGSPSDGARRGRGRADAVPPDRRSGRRTACSIASRSTRSRSARVAVEGPGAGGARDRARGARRPGRDRARARHHVGRRRPPAIERVGHRRCVPGRAQNASRRPSGAC